MSEHKETSKKTIEGTGQSQFTKLESSNMLGWQKNLYAQFDPRSVMALLDRDTIESVESMMEFDSTLFTVIQTLIDITVGNNIIICAEHGNEGSTKDVMSPKMQDYVQFHLIPYMRRVIEEYATLGICVTTFAPCRLSVRFSEVVIQAPRVIDHDALKINVVYDPVRGCNYYFPVLNNGGISDEENSQLHKNVLVTAAFPPKRDGKLRSPAAKLVSQFQFLAESFTVHVARNRQSVDPITYTRDAGDVSGKELWNDHNDAFSSLETVGQMRARAHVIANKLTDQVRAFVCRAQMWRAEIGLFPTHLSGRCGKLHKRNRKSLPRNLVGNSSLLWHNMDLPLVICPC
jgi:hypothetical protein